MKKICPLFFSLLLLSGCSLTSEHSNSIFFPDTVEKTTKGGVRSAKSSDDSLNETNPIEELNSLSTGNTPNISDILPASPTTGIKKLDEFQQHYAVVVDNSVDSRPQTGLHKADIVFEIPYNEFLTRFLAIYHDEHPEHVGPVRKLNKNLYLLALDWKQPLLFFEHSQELTQLIEKTSLPFRNAATDPQHFSLDRNRKAPYNQYLRVSSLPLLNTPFENPHFAFGFPDLSSSPAAIDILIQYSELTKTQYIYNPATSRYFRYLNDAKHEDFVDKTPIETDNVILQFLPLSASQKKTGNELSLVGSGNAYFFSKGKVTKGFWEKKDAHSPTIYLDKNKQLMELSQGKTWIQLVKTNTPIQIQ